MRRRLLIAGGRFDRFLRSKLNVKYKTSGFDFDIAGGGPGDRCPVGLGRFGHCLIEAQQFLLDLNFSSETCPSKLKGVETFGCGAWFQYWVCRILP